MMIARTILATLALATGAVAGPCKASASPVCNANNCLRALRATARLAQAKLDCAAYLAVTTTPTVTATVYDVSTSVTTSVEEIVATNTAFETATSTIRETSTLTVYTETITVTVPPQVAKRSAAAATIPAYASACSGAVRYSSACTCIGASEATTVTAPATTVTLTLSSSDLTTASATTIVSTVETTLTVSTATITVTDVTTVSTIAISTVTAAPAPTNLLSNPGFESAGTIEPWVRYSTSPVGITQNSNIVRSGSQSALITYIPGSVESALATYQRVNVVANTPYRYSIFIRQQQTPGCPRMYITCGTASHVGFFGIKVIQGPDFYNKWAEITTECTWTAANVADAAVHIRIPSDCPAGTNLFFDDAVLIQQI